jgi:hypothetical protein
MKTIVITEAPGTNLPSARELLTAGRPPLPSARDVLAGAVRLPSLKALVAAMPSAVRAAG